MVQQLFEDLARRGIVLVADGGRLRFHPRSEMTPKLVDRLKIHKAEVLAIMADPWPEAETDLAPCPKCGGWELWQTLDGRWRCCRCDPPTASRRWAEKAEQFKRLY